MKYDSVVLETANYREVMKTVQFTYTNLVPSLAQFQICDVSGFRMSTTYFSDREYDEEGSHIERFLIEDGLARYQGFEVIVPVQLPEPSDYGVLMYRSERYTADNSLLHTYELHYDGDFPSAEVRSDGVVSYCTRSYGFDFEGAESVPDALRERVLAWSVYNGVTRVYVGFQSI